jgi:hypothetical protein
MSVKVLARVWEHSRQKGTALLLALAIADYCNDEAWAWPSIVSLRRKTRLRSDRTVQILLRKLEAAGEIAIERGAGMVGTAGGSQRTNLYRVLVGLEGGAKSAPPCLRRGNAKAAQGGAIPRKGGALAIAPDPLVNPSIDPSSRGQQFFSPNNKDLTPEQRAANFHRLAQMTSELARKKHMDTAEARRPRR